MSTDLISLIQTVAISQLLTPTLKYLGESGLKRLQQLGAETLKLLTEAGRQPQSVEPKILIPLVQAALLEPDPVLTQKWAALLANAADPQAKVEVTVSFIEVLKQLGVVEVKIITYLYDGLLEDRLRFKTPDFKPLYVILGIPDPIFYIAIDNLLRLQLCAVPPDRFEINKEGELLQHLAKKDQVIPTSFGLAFLQACSAPICN